MDTSRFTEEDFSGFIRELIDAKRFSDSKEEGIAKLRILGIEQNNLLRTFASVSGLVFINQKQTGMGGP